MQARWSAVAGVLAALLIGAALLGGGVPDGAGAGSSAAGARARLDGGEERARRAALRAAAAEEAAAARGIGRRGEAGGEIAVEVDLPAAPGAGGGTGRCEEESGTAHDHRGPFGTVPDAVPLDGFEPVTCDADPNTPAAPKWLERHQMEDGSWDAGGLASRCVGHACTDPGPPGHAAGDTGLVLMAFFGEGETHKTPRYGKAVRAGLKHLKWIQDVEGCFGTRTGEGWLEDHALATLAMAEAYGLTQSPLFKSSAQNAVNFLESCRDPYLAWRYGATTGPRDLALSAWALCAVKEAKGAGLDVPVGPFEGTMTWFRDRTDFVTGRVWSGEEGEPASDAPTAMGVVVSILCGVPRDDPLVRAGVETLLGDLPETPPSRPVVDPLLDWFGTFALFQVGGWRWRRWATAVRNPVDDRLLAPGEGCAAGSVDPASTGPGAGVGRIRTTAMELMVWGTHYRYQRVYAEED